MKTININLLNNLKDEAGKKPASAPLDSKTRKIVTILLLLTFVLFVISFGGWLGICSMNKSAETELSALEENHLELKKELMNSNLNSKKLKEEKELLELKLIGINQIKNQILPWHGMLSEISKIVPKDIKIREITKDSTKSRRGTKPPKAICVTGDVFNEKNPLHLVSFFALNMNEHYASKHLYDSKINKVDFDTTAELYNFTICSKIKPAK